MRLPFSLCQMYILESGMKKGQNALLAGNTFVWNSPSLPLMTRFWSAPPNVLLMTYSPCCWPKNLLTISAVSMSIRWISLLAMLTSICRESLLTLMHVIRLLFKIQYSSLRVSKSYTTIWHSLEMTTSRLPFGETAQS